MSTTILAVFINLLVTALPFAGINLPEESVVDAVQTIVAIVTGLWIWYQRTQRGDVGTLGFPKK